MTENELETYQELLQYLTTLIKAVDEVQPRQVQQVQPRVRFESSFRNHGTEDEYHECYGGYIDFRQIEKEEAGLNHHGREAKSLIGHLAKEAVEELEGQPTKVELEGQDVDGWQLEKTVRGFQQVDDRMRPVYNKVRLKEIGYGENYAFLTGKKSVEFGSKET